MKKMVAKKNAQIVTAVVLFLGLFLLNHHLYELYADKVLQMLSPNGVSQALVYIYLKLFVLLPVFCLGSAIDEIDRQFKQIEK